MSPSQVMEATDLMVQWQISLIITLELIVPCCIGQENRHVLFIIIQFWAGNGRAVMRVAYTPLRGLRQTQYKAHVALLNSLEAGNPK